MLTTSPTQEMIDDWKSIYEANKDKLIPNRKSANEILDYLHHKYQITKLENPEYNEVILSNTLEYLKALNKPINKSSIQTAAYEIKNSDAGKALYQNQDEVFQGESIIVGLEFTTNFFMVNGSALLHDELTAFAGLDKTELTNYFLVAQYLSCQENNKKTTII